MGNIGTTQLKVVGRWESETDAHFPGMHCSVQAQHTTALDNKTLSQAECEASSQSHTLRILF